MASCPALEKVRMRRTSPRASARRVCCVRMFSAVAAAGTRAVRDTSAGRGKPGGSGCGVVRPGRVVIHGGGRRLGRRLGQDVEGGKGESLESRKHRVRGGQAVKRGTGGSLESRKQKAQVWKGRVRRGARARRAAPDLERACHQVTVNASGGQSNAMDRSAAVRR